MYFLKDSAAFGDGKNNALNEKTYIYIYIYRKWLNHLNYVNRCLISQLS